MIKYKTFRDPVHDYISIPDCLCENFIDTILFQRLRNIEQTSMRTLFPSARHDRFSHSLGVFHIANICFDYLIQNTNASLLKGTNPKSYEKSFLVAALMHDCGHSPFSHIFESFYNNPGNKADKFLLQQVGADFKEDFGFKCKELERPADHEIFSSAIFLKHFSKPFKKFSNGCDPILVARMITGCLHEPAKTKKEQFENCLIGLINSNAIDVDKLDFIVRDTLHSGINNISIDYHRLLSAIEIVNHDNKLVPAFRKSALSVIQNVIDARNYLYKWIFSHHTVLYYAELMKSALNKISKRLSPRENPEALLERIFSKEAFEHPISFKKFRIYLPCDIDILSLFKQYLEVIPEVKEIMSRKPKLVPLWKTKAEFDAIFMKLGATQKTKICVKIKDHLRPIIRKKEYLKEIKIIPVKPKLAKIRENEIYIDYGRNIISSFTGKGKEEKENETFYYVFIPNEYGDKIDKIVSILQNIKTY